MSLSRNETAELLLFVWKAARKGWFVFVLFAEQLCHSPAAVPLLDEHLSSSETPEALLSAWKSATIKDADDCNLKFSTSQPGVVKELDVQPAVSCARATPFPTTGPRTRRSRTRDPSDGLRAISQRVGAGARCWTTKTRRTRGQQARQPTSNTAASTQEPRARVPRQDGHSQLVNPRKFPTPQFKATKELHHFADMNPSRLFDSCRRASGRRAGS